jgi:hypothetical protein
VDDTRVPFYPRKVKSGDIVFLKTKYMNHYLKHMHPLIQNPYVLITHFGSEEVPNQWAHLLEDPKILKWFGINATVDHPKLAAIPLGIALVGIDKLVEVQEKEIPKRRLLYSNFNEATHPDRMECKRYFEDKKFCFNDSRRPFAEYLEEVKASKFTVSPRGCGIDCHRVWESLLIGTIPVVTSTKLDPLYEEFPILIVKDWSEVTEDFLNQKHGELLPRFQNQEKLYAKYWLELVEKASSGPHFYEDALLEKSIIVTSRELSGK